MEQPAACADNQSEMTMSEVTTAADRPVSAQTLEHVLGTGDLSKLSTQQRVEYYAKTCQSLGLNPLTRPFRFLALNGQIQLYATKDCTDQLRSVHGITLHLVDKTIDGDLFIVTARAKNKDGREDEDIGAVALGALRGESRANALMKGTTKAKRRVTLSICGLGGMPDESELDGMPGAKTFDAEEEPPVAPIRAVAAHVPRAARRSAAAHDTRSPADGDVEKYADVYAKHDIAIELLDETDGRKWLDNLEMLLAHATTQEMVVVISDHESVKRAMAKAPPNVRARIDEVLANAYKRFVEPPEEEVVIAGAENVGAG